MDWKMQGVTRTERIAVVRAVTATTYAPSFTPDDPAMLAVDSTTGALLVQGTITTSGAQNATVNLTQVGSVAIALGQTTAAASLPVTVANNEVAIAVTQSGAPWSDNLTQFAGIGLTQPLLSSSFGAVTTSNAKGSSGNILGFSVTSINSGLRYFQIFNRTTTVTGSEVPVFSIPVPAGTATQPTTIQFGQDYFGFAGFPLSTGITWACSTVQATFTSGTSTDHNVHFLYN